MHNETNIEALIFDMDGVIIDSKDHVESFWREKLELYGIEADGDDMETRFHGRPARHIIDDIFAGLPDETREDLAEECSRYDSSVKQYRMIPGVEAFLQQVTNQGVPLGLVTSALPPKVDRMIEGLSFPSPFRVIVTADLVQNGKPDPECYLQAAAKLGVSPERSLVFEDSVSGVKAASEAGAMVIGINEAHIAGYLKEAGAGIVVPDFRPVRLINGGSSYQLVAGDNGLVFGIITESREVH